MKTKKTLIGLLLLNGFTGHCLANAKISIDLANDDGKTLAKPSDSTITVTIRNKLPTVDYSNYIKHYYPEIAGLPKPDMSNVPGSPALGVKSAVEPKDNMDDKAGVSAGINFIKPESSATNKNTDREDTEIKALIEDYLSTHIIDECNALFSQKTSAVFTAGSEKAVSQAVNALNVELERYSARITGDYQKTVNHIFRQVAENYESISDIPAEVMKEVKAVNNYQWLDNSSECTELYNRALDTVNRTQGTVTINFYDGKSASLEVTRNYNDNAKSWLYRWEEEPPTVWLYNLSYVFIQDFDNDAYYTESYNTEEQTFLIRKYSDSGFEYMPAAMFTYVFQPDKYRIKGNAWGASAGISLDPDKPGILGGISYIMGQNVTVTAGIAITQQDELKGEYSAYSKNAEFNNDMPPDTVDSALSADQLVKDTYKGSWFLAIGFTFE